MPMRLYRLHEIRARLDEALRRELARRHPDPLRLLRLRAMTRHARSLIDRLLRPARAAR